MRVTRQSEALLLDLNPFEQEVLLRLLQSMVQNYRIAPEELDEKTAGVWYSEQGCKTAGMSAEETRHWRHDLHVFKSARAGRIESWMRQLSRDGAKNTEWRVPETDVADLLVTLNDHRLLMAARWDIGQMEMDLEAREVRQRLKPEQQVALFEIHILSFLIEGILHALGTGYEPA